MRMLTRPGYREEEIWRAALGNAEPLLVFAGHTDCLDAPTLIPTGGAHYRPYYRHTPRNQPEIKQ